jgi:hypothetical protein
VRNWCCGCLFDQYLQRRNIEILKVRFGEAALQVCEVMLKDMTDSQRIDQHVQSQQAVRFRFPYPLQTLSDFVMRSQSCIQ